MDPVTIVLNSVLAVYTFGSLQLCATEPTVAEPQKVAQEKPFQTEEAEIQTPSFRPVQTLEERSDAMLFEAQALVDTPFGQAIILPFDNL